jgi:hypothetical protein
MRSLLSCLTPALVTSFCGLTSKMVMGVLLFTFKDHKKFILNFLLTIGNRCVGNTGGYLVVTHLFYCDIQKSALITASATLHPFSLSQYSSRRTERRWRYRDGSQNGGKHRAGLLPEKSLRRGRAVRMREEKVVHGCQARTLSRVIEPS